MSIEPSAVSDAARAYLRLHLVDGLGPILIARLVDHFGDPRAVVGQSAARLERVKGIGPKAAQRIAFDNEEAVEREIEAACSRGVRIICVCDDDYPQPLRRTPDPPPVLYLRGRLQPEDAVALGIVGSRHCSRYGAEQAERFAALAAEVGLTIVSGMALGIDTAAHRGSLLAKGRTIAVLGCGMKYLYPPRSEELATRIAENGALLSEFPMDTPPAEFNFPRRNRIIAGMSLGVLVVEAAKHSGALLTAAAANEYNREVFAVPGRIDTSHSDGCHRLIRTGTAKLVTCLPDILDELGDVGRILLPRADATHDDAARPDADAAAAEPLLPLTAAMKLSETERRLLDAMPAEPVSVETLTELSGLPPAAVASALTSLQLKGLVRREPGEIFSRKISR